MLYEYKFYVICIYITDSQVESRSCQLFANNCCQQKSYKFDVKVVITDFIDKLM